MFNAYMFIAICLSFFFFLSIDIAPRLSNARWSLLDTQIYKQTNKPTKAGEKKPSERLLLAASLSDAAIPVSVGFLIVFDGAAEMCCH